MGRVDLEVRASGKATVALLIALLGGCASRGDVPDLEAAKPEEASARAPAADGDAPEAYRGAFSLLFENDIFIGNDSRFTAGAGLAWTSAELESYPEGNFHRELGDWLSCLPLVGAPGYQRFLQWHLGMEMYTPREIFEPEPPPGDHPYAGLLALDTSVFARSDVSEHQYTLRVGLVGPSSGAERMQRLIHEITGSGIPVGWDTQLDDEPILNGFYQYHRRLHCSDLTGSLGTDLTVNGGGGLGNYYIGGNVGGTFRLGLGLPNSYTATPMLGGVEPVVGLSPSHRVYGYFFLGLQGFGVARFLPTDGNTFRDSRSGYRDDWFASASAGILIGYERLLLTYTYNGISGLTDSDGIRANSEDDYAMLTLSYLF